MRTAAVLGLVLLLGSVWMIHSDDISPEKLIQDGFDLDRFMGRWYDLAVVSTCPHYMHRKRVSPVIVALDLQGVGPGRNFTVTSTRIRNGTCQPSSRLLSLTDVPGRFFHHNPKFSADVYSYVLRVSYEHYAVLLLLSTEQPSGNRTTSLKLLSRAVDVSPAALEEFKTLVRQHKLRDDSIIMNKDVCTVNQHVTEATAQPQVSGSKTNAVPPENENKP
ncbi:protein AMBP-like isoform X2 [Betta splendens]|uniref:Protein AMBP-like isoform X2 n=1 Tax=Betta splendens TaxID=158456 RepID=A0A9W2Y6H0_BETSP|nr:protein AMBP-like isoform X2 [Betta splendens]